MTAPPPPSPPRSRPDAIKPIAFRASWPTRYYFECDHVGCPGRFEMWVDKDGLLVDEGTRDQAVARAVAFAGWLCLVTILPNGKKRTAWLCADCAVEMVDPRDPVVREAMESRELLARAEVQAGRGTNS